MWWITASLIGTGTIAMGRSALLHNRNDLRPCLKWAKIGLSFMGPGAVTFFISMMLERAAQ